MKTRKDVKIKDKEIDYNKDFEVDNQESKSVSDTSEGTIDNISFDSNDDNDSDVTEDSQENQETENNNKDNKFLKKKI